MADGHVAPALDAAQPRAHAGLRQPDGGHELAHRDPVADEAQEVRPHGQRRDARPAARLLESALELVVELDRERHDDLGEKGRERQRSHVNDATHTNRKPTILGPVMYSGHELR